MFMKNKLASNLSEYDLHAFRDILREEITQSESRLENKLSTSLDRKLSTSLEKKLSASLERKLSTSLEKKLSSSLERKLSTKLEKVLATKLDQHSKMLFEQMDIKNRKQTDELSGIIRDLMDSTDRLYVSKEDFEKHSSDLHAHQ